MKLLDFEKKLEIKESGRCEKEAIKTCSMSAYSTPANDNELPTDH
jgi:hypothetical protein